MSNTPVIITCALTGGSRFNPAHPYMPVTPAEIAASALAAAKAGAAIVHIHVRDPVTKAGSQDPRLYREVVNRIRESGVDIVINLTCGGNARFMPDPEDESRAGPGTTVAPVAVRVKHIEENVPEICSLDTTTGNHADGKDDFVYLNTPRTLRAMAQRFKTLGVKPEIEVFGAGDIVFAKAMIEEGLIDAPPMFQFVLGTRWNAPADPETMTYMRNLLPTGAVWTGFGIAQRQSPMVAQSILLGGNVRVGLEDNLYLKKGVFARNEELVERAVTLVQTLGRNVATPTEARTILGLQARA